MGDNSSSAQGHLVIDDLDRQIAIRGLSYGAFAEKAKVDRATVARAIKRQTLKSKSRARILVALGQIPVIEGPVELVKSA